MDSEAFGPIHWMEVTGVFPAFGVLGKVFLLATRTGLEPATTGSTVRDSNQLSYRAVRRSLAGLGDAGVNL